MTNPLRRAVLRGLLAALLILTFACVHSAIQTSKWLKEDAITVTIKNNNVADINVFIFCNGAKETALRQIATNQTVSKQIRPICQNVTLLIDIIGSNEVYMTENTNLSPGNVLYLEVQSHLPMSLPWVKPAP